METIVRHRNEGEATWFLNALVVTKADYTETGGAYYLMEHLFTAASNPPTHIHVDEEEAFYVIDGELEIEVDGVTTVARPGSFVLAPSGLPHAFRVMSDTARVLSISSAPVREHERRVPALPSRKSASPPRRSRCPCPRHPIPPCSPLRQRRTPSRSFPRRACEAPPHRRPPGRRDIRLRLGARARDRPRRRVAWSSCATRGELGEMAGLAAGEADAGEPRRHPRGRAARRGRVARREPSRAAGLARLGNGGAGCTPDRWSPPRPRDVESAIAAIVEELRPDIVVTLDGSDGHRDHAVVRDATLAALQTTTWRPSRTYLVVPPPLVARRLRRRARHRHTGRGHHDPCRRARPARPALEGDPRARVAASALRRDVTRARATRSFPPIACCVSTRRGQAASPSVTGFPPESVSASAPATAAVSVELLLERHLADDRVVV